MVLDDIGRVALDDEVMRQSRKKRGGSLESPRGFHVRRLLHFHRNEHKRNEHKA